MPRQGAPAAPGVGIRPEGDWCGAREGWAAGQVTYFFNLADGGEKLELVVEEFLDGVGAVYDTSALGNSKFARLAMRCREANSSGDAIVPYPASYGLGTCVTHDAATEPYCRDRPSRIDIVLFA